MDRKAAKEVLHLRGWLERVEWIIERGKDTIWATTPCKRPATP